MYDYNQGENTVGFRKTSGVWPHGVVGLYAGLCRSRECINLCPCSLRYKKERERERENNFYSKQEETEAMILMGKWDRKNLTCISLHSPLRHKARGSSPGITWPSLAILYYHHCPQLWQVFLMVIEPIFFFFHVFKTNLEFPPHNCPLLNIEMNNILFPEFHWDR